MQVFRRTTEAAPPLHRSPGANLTCGLTHTVQPPVTQQWELLAAPTHPPFTLVAALSAGQLYNFQKFLLEINSDSV